MEEQFPIKYYGKEIFIAKNPKDDVYQRGLG